MSIPIAPPDLPALTATLQPERGLRLPCGSSYGAVTVGLIWLLVFYYDTVTVSKVGVKPIIGSLPVIDVFRVSVM